MFYEQKLERILVDTKTLCTFSGIIYQETITSSLGGGKIYQKEGNVNFILILNEIYLELYASLVQISLISNVLIS